MENAKKFFEELAKTEEAKALFASIEKPETEDARIAAYVEIAAKLGVTLTAEDVAAYFASNDNTDDAELDDEELAQLVGGGENAGCASSYQQKENCWWNDGCDRVWNDYDNYMCSYNNTLSLKDKIRKRIHSQYYRYCSIFNVNTKLKEYGLE